MQRGEYGARQRGLTLQALAIPAVRRVVLAFHALTLGESNAKTSGQVLGALLGGLLIAVLAAPGAVLAGAGLFGMSAVLAALAARGWPARAHPRGGGRREHVRQLRAGVQALNGDPETRRPGPALAR